MWTYSLTFILLSLSKSNTKDTPVPTPSLYYKEHRIRTEQLCPDLQESLKNKDIDTANYPYKSVFRLADQVWRTADPCIFESRGVRNQYTTVVIKAIHADNQQWNYTGAQPCPEHIKLKLPNRRIFSKVGLPLCTIRKPSNPLKLFQGPFYHPHVWQLSQQKMGISFALYENESLPDPSPTDDLESTEISQQNGFLLNSKLPKFVHIVFASFLGDTCSLRVQQYLIDPKKEHCNSTKGRFFALCGMYNCSEEEHVLKQAGFWGDSPLRLSEMHKLIDFIRSKQYRNSEPSVVDFFFSIMRLMIMPMVFLVAYYVTRQLREKLANRQLIGQLRALTQAGGRGAGAGNSGSGPTVGVRPFGISRVGVGVGVLGTGIGSPSSSRRERFEDPPPPYETIVTPPTYLEATSHLKLKALQSALDLDQRSQVPTVPSYFNIFNITEPAEITASGNDNEINDNSTPIVGVDVDTTSPQTNLDTENAEIDTLERTSTNTATAIIPMSSSTHEISVNNYITPITTDKDSESDHSEITTSTTTSEVVLPSSSISGDGKC